VKAAQIRDAGLLSGGRQVKILTTYETKNAFPKVLKLSQKDVVIVTNRGKPVAAIQGLKDEDDLTISWNAVRNFGP
jgi:prevent-host-death family protein